MHGFNVSSKGAHLKIFAIGVLAPAIVFAGPTPSEGAPIPQRSCEARLVNEHQAITGELRETFTPLVEQLARSAGNLTPEQLRAYADKVAPVSDLGLTTYDRTWEAEHIPRVARELGAIQSNVFKGLGRIQSIADNRPFGYFRQIWKALFRAQLDPNIFSQNETAVWIRSSRIRNGGFFIPALAKQFEFTFTPVGFYGQDLADRMTRTQRVILELAMDKLEEMAANISRDKIELLSRETARGRDSASNCALATMLESLGSLHQLLSILLGSAVPGVNDGSEALRSLVFSDSPPLLEDFTKRVYAGLIGPLALSGHYFNEPLFQRSDGSLVVSPRLRKLLKEWRIKTIRPRQGLRGTCPMAHSPESEPSSGIQKLAELYWEVFSALE